MLNEERKERFYEYKLNTAVTNIDPIKARIKRASKFEHIYKKDLCDFNINEITEMYKLLNYTDFNAILVMNNTLDQYTNWCLNQNLIINGQNAYQILSRETLAELLNKTLVDHQIVSRDTVLTWVESLLNPRDQYIILSVFEYGKSKINFQDTINARLEDIDEKTHRMRLYSNRFVNVSEALIQIAKRSNVTLDLMPPYGRNAHLEEDGTIIKKPGRAIDRPSSLGRAVYKSFVKALESIDVGYITINKLHISGQIHMIKELAQQYNLSSEEIIKNPMYRSEIENQYDSTITPTVFLKKYGNYL